MCGKTAASPHPNILQLGSNEWGIPSGNHNGKSLTNGGVYWNMIAGCLTAIYRISHPFSENSANWGCIYVPSISGISDLDQQKPRKIDGFLHVGVDFGISSNWGSHIRVCLVPMSLHNYLQIHTEYIYIYVHIMYHIESCIIKCSMYLCCADFKHLTVGWEMDLDLDISTLIISPTQPPLLNPVH